MATDRRELPGVGARRVAARVLHRVAVDQAWASLTLDAEIDRARLSRLDAALATEIVYGVLRVMPRLDEALDAFLRTPERTEPMLRACLRVGAYQLLHLSRVPPHAAVGETVSACRAERGKKLAGVANAVLRKIAKARPAEPTRPTRMVLPSWVEQSVARGLGEERAEHFLAARRLPPPLGLRSNDPEALLAKLERERPKAELSVSSLVPGALIARGVGDPRALPGWSEGEFSVQELGSQRVVALVGVEPGERVADLCAGHGTKTLAFASRVGEAGHVVAVDLYEEKLARLERERARLGIPESRITTRPVDLTRGLGGLEEQSFDRVFVDAPCTGTGTVHRRPELVGRLQPGDPARLAELQRQLVRNAQALVKPGGTLILATCAATHEEGPGLADALDIEPVVNVVGPWSGEDMDVYHVLTWRL